MKTARMYRYMRHHFPNDLAVELSERAGRRRARRTANWRQVEASASMLGSDRVRGELIVGRPGRTSYAIGGPIRRLPLPGGALMKGVRGSRGFTLIELLVVIAIIAVLIGALLLGRAGGPRGGTPRSMTNNLKQLGLAMHNCHQSINCWPPGHFGTGWNDWNSQTMLLSYIEQNLIFNAINFAQIGGCSACPAIGPSITVTPRPCWPSSTSCSAHLQHRPAVEPLRAHQLPRQRREHPEGIFDNAKHGASNGLFASVKHEDGSPNVQPVSFRDITDGLSNTAAYSEKVKGIGSGFTGFDPLKPSSAEMSVNVNKTGQTNGVFNDMVPNVYYAACRALNPYNPNGSTGNGGFNASGSISGGEYWWDGHYETGQYNHIMTPNTGAATTPPTTGSTTAALRPRAAATRQRR